MSLCGKLKFNASTRDLHKPVDAKTMFRDLKEMCTIMANLLWIKLEGKVPHILEGKAKSRHRKQQEKKSSQVGLMAFLSPSFTN